MTTAPLHLRQSGISQIGEVPWGTHFCQFYQTRQDLLDILVPYFKTGLENGEFCMWITAKPLDSAAARAALAKALPNLETYEARGQLEIMPHDQWYLKDGVFKQERVLAGWVDKLDKALKCGFEGLRLTGNTFWLERKDWQDFTDYEAAVNEVIGRYRMIALCTYSLDKCTASDIIDVISNHEFALIKQQGKWVSMENTQLKQTKAALKASEERWRATLASIGDAVICTDADGNITFMNAVAEKLTGWTFLDACDRPVQEVFNIINEQGRRPGENPVARTLAQGGITGLANHTLLITKDSHEMAIDDSAAPIRDNEGKIAGAILVFRDISLRRKAENALKDSEERLRRLYASMTEGVCAHQIIYDEAGKAVDYIIQEINPAYEAITGIKREAAVGKKASELYGTGQAPYLEIYARVAATGEPAYIETYFPPMNKHFSISVFSPERGRFGTVFSDITERKRGEQVKDDFIGMVSHELRTPLTVVLGSLRTALSPGMTPEDVVTLIENAISGGDSMATIIDNLLELSRSQTGRLKLTTQKVDTHRAVADAIQKVKLQYPDHGYLAEVANDIPPMTADPVRIEHILYNLIENAAKYSPAGSEIEVKVTEDERHLVFAVRDRGIGIPRERQGELFEPFQRLATTEPIKGLGLGLVVCKRLVEAHSGRIWVESASDKGSTFCFTIPLGEDK